MFALAHSTSKRVRFVAADMQMPCNGQKRCLRTEKSRSLAAADASDVVDESTLWLWILEQRKSDGSTEGSNK